MIRRLPGVSLPTQAFLLMAFAIALVSSALIWHQGESIRTQVLEERLAAIARQARVHQYAVAQAGIGADRAALAAYFQPDMDQMMAELGAIQVVITDETGLIIAAADDAEVGQMEGAEEVQLVLSGVVDSVMRPEKGEEEVDFAFTIPLTFPAFKGALHVEEDIQALNIAILEARRDAALPAVLMLLIAAPLTGLLARRVLRRSQLNEQEQAWQSRFQSLIQNASDVILVVDPKGSIHYVSPASERVLGLPASDLLGITLLDLVHPADVGAAQIALADVAEAPGRETRSEYRIRHGDGHWFFAEIHSANLREDPAVRGTVLTIRDITGRKTMEAQLAHQALHDPLTGLANRALFNDRLGHAVARARRWDRGLAVVVVDLDEFKLVNDTHGHQAGDTILAHVGQRMQACIREGDTAARLGGDEFAILLEDVTPDEVAPISARILAAFDEPVVTEHGAIRIGASVGVSNSGDGLIDTADLLSTADIAMYAAKDSGRGRMTVFEPGMRMAENERVEAAAELRVAIDDGQFEVRYQPIVELPSGDVLGMEALVRWRHPVRGEVMPADFIPFAEKTGLIVPLGALVLREACRQTRIWHLEQPDRVPLSISVNISGAQLDDTGLIDAVEGALRDSGLPAASLTLEITESVLVNDADATTNRLLELKALGVQLAIDDFGTGYSSLSYLRRFPIDIIKIDKSFVDGLIAGGPSLALAKSIVRLAHNLQLKTVAEGVEEPQQRARLAAMGCDYAQGYLFARPLDVESATELLRETTADLPLAG